MHVFRLQIIIVVSDEMTAYNEIRRNLVLGNSVNENQLIYSRRRNGPYFKVLFCLQSQLP